MSGSAAEMAEQPLAKMVEIAVREFTSDGDGTPQPGSGTAPRDDGAPKGKRRRVEVIQPECEAGEESIETLLYSASKTLCQRLDAIEADLNCMEDKCKCLRAKVDMLASHNARRPAPTAGHPASANAEGRASLVAVQRPLPRVQVLEEESGEGEGEGLGEGEVSGVQTVAVCADTEGEGEEGVDGETVAILPDATNLLYQLMY